ncbi:MAG: hypothetical protein H8F28_14440 [Fibrella sp.]|nr:hypothetical protein [Armatimonadota bacterium]
MPLVDDSGNPRLFVGNEVVVFNMCVKGEETSVIDDAVAVLTPPDFSTGRRSALFLFSPSVPVPAAGTYEITFQVAGLTYPIGRKQPVTVQRKI